MTRTRRSLSCAAAVAVAAGALGATASAALAKTTAIRGDVLSVSSHAIVLVGASLTPHSYTVPTTGLRYGDELIVRHHKHALRPYVIGRAANVSYLANATAASKRGEVSVRVADATVTYRASHRLTVDLPAAGVRKGAKVLVTLHAGGRLHVTVQLVHGTPRSGSVETSGVVTHMAGRNVTMLTNAGERVHFTVPAGSSVSNCDPVSFYYSPGSGNHVSMVVGDNGGPIAGCQHLAAGHGFVTAVAGDDSTLTVRTLRGSYTLHVSGAGLRDQVDGISITDYVIFTYLTGSGGPTLETVTDTSVAENGVVDSIHGTTVKVRTFGLGVLELVASGPHQLDGVKPRDAVDVDYYTAFDGTMHLVNIDDRGPAQNGGNGGGPSGSGGSAGSGGSGGSAGSSGSD